MNANNKLLLAGLAASLLPISAMSAVSISDVPLAVRNNVRTNFIFMIDDSGSMKDKVSGSGGKTRMAVAQDAAKAVLDSLPSAKSRVAMVSFSNAGSQHLGGALDYGLRDLDSDSLSGIKSEISKLSPANWTPLSETLAGVGRYLANASADNTLNFSGNQTAKVSKFFEQNNTGRTELAGMSDSDYPIEYWCQRSNVIVMTDGESTEDVGLSGNVYLRDFDNDCPNCTYDRKTSNNHPPTSHIGGTHTYNQTDSSPRGSDYLDDVAQAIHEVDLRPDLLPPAGKAKGRTVSVYMIGFADDTLKDSPLMQESAAQGGGKFMYAGDEDKLKEAFQGAIDDAFAKENAAAAVAVVNTQVVVDNTAYASRYNSGTWSGDLMGYRLNTTTGIPIEPPAWSAAGLLAKRTDPRKIVTYSGSNGVVFSGAMGGLSAADVAALRGARLGDIVNAEPVVVKYGSRTVVFQPANDGMLHAFEGKLEAGGGEELFAYVPRALYTGSAPALSSQKLPLKAGANHQYLVDATPAVADFGSQKLLVGGLGKGGKAYYALDISSPDANNEVGYASKVKWEVVPDASKSGYSFATPLLVKTSKGDRVVVPSGYNNSDGKGYVFLLDPADGSVEATIETGVSGDLAYLAKPQDAVVTAVVDVIYGGDTQGNLFRFNLASETSVRIAQLKDGSGNVQPVTSAPLVTTGTNAGEFRVFVGTGQYLDVADIASTRRQTLYGVFDNSSVATPTLPNIRGSNGASCPTEGGDGAFVCQTLSGNDSSGYSVSANAIGSKKGWYVDLPVSGSRITSQGALSRGGVLVYTANKPTDTKCEPGGSSYLLTLNPETGGSLGNGVKGMVWISSALASRPVLVETADGERALVRHADQSFTSTKLWTPPVAGATTFRVLSWRELL
ncbi:pilus assembly protein [Crenobacter caeni]|uniref:VWA domain-containing protein n=1 Tax=Crenobacter caeni TaxID=2705474 RepID=A0A6B2KQK1_9NEIS|nr:PilC/PilY family type IV pilus protein [Crenobacter caeni]NDV12420.1 VWA domain-containing protein [Crenobacter caeni]